MGLFFVAIGAVVLGYLIPVLASLFFSLAVGRVAPGMLSQKGRIKGGFVVMHGLVWALASMVSGYEIAKMVQEPKIRVLACVAAGLILLIALLSNVTAMKKRQSPLQIGGMVVATVVGIGVGLEIYLKMAKGV